MQRDRSSGPSGSSLNLPIVVMGTARLPEAWDAGVLMIELAMDSRCAEIHRVASNIRLPGYTELLRRLLIGKRPEDIPAVAVRICAHLRGPLLKPTVAALTNAAGQERAPSGLS